MFGCSSSENSDDMWIWSTGKNYFSISKNVQKFPLLRLLVLSRVETFATLRIFITLVKSCCLGSLSKYWLKSTEKWPKFARKSEHLSRKFLPANVWTKKIYKELSKRSRSQGWIIPLLLDWCRFNLRIRSDVKLVRVSLVQNITSNRENLWVVLKTGYQMAVIW